MTGSSQPALAWRNLWRNRRRTILTLTSIGFGTLLSVLFTGLGDASFSKMIDLAARLGGGHVTLQHPEYLDAPSLGRSIEGVSELRARAERDREVTRTVARITGQAMIASAREAHGATFVAIDPADEDGASLSLLGSLVHDAGFETKRGHGVILGERLAHNLGVELGKKVVYTLTDKRGEVTSGLVWVSDLVRTGADDVDASVCLLPIDAVREVLGYGPDEATLVAAFIGDQRHSAAVAARLSVDAPAGVVALPWPRTQPDLAAFIKMKVSSTRIFELIIALLVAAGIFNTIFVSVMERTREFGVMMALGFSPGYLFGLVMWESLWLGLVGLAGGVLATLWPYYYLATHGFDASAMTGGKGTAVAGVVVDPVMRVGLYPESGAVIAVAVLAATLLAGLYPAWRAGRVAPVDAIALV